MRHAVSKIQYTRCVYWGCKPRYFYHKSRCFRCRINNGADFKSIYNLTFPLPQFSHSVEATNSLREHPNPDKLKTTVEKLRWYCYYNNLFQKEVADIIGVDRTTYIHYESIDHDLYPQDKLRLLANLYKINIPDLLDDYNLFLHNGQAKQIKALRNRLGLTITEFARLYNTTPNTVRNWEKNEVIILKSTWKKLFQTTTQNLKTY